MAKTLVGKVVLMIRKLSEEILRHPKLTKRHRSLVEWIVKTMEDE
jgi:hypothetical protein